MGGTLLHDAVANFRFLADVKAFIARCALTTLPKLIFDVTYESTALKKLTSKACHECTTPNKL